MTEAKRPHLIASCECGAVRIEAAGAPIMAVACCCASCQEAGRRFELLPGAPPVLDADGGTPFVLHRKDRVRCVAGGEKLIEHRLDPASATRRMVANCCNSAMFLDFTKGHWLSIYSRRLGGSAPPIEMRTMTGDRREDAELSEDVPNHKTHSGRFMWKLLGAWIAMGLRCPAVKGIPA